ncbi:MAG: sulfatase-like hydrolase/transferase [Lentisphaerae bacterium]|nr:sulfatase-like hydrolase/transferase [Lentisphaerota bacterium]
MTVSATRPLKERSHKLMISLSSQPDILLIMPDQMRGDCLSILKHPVIRTPNMDSLAAEGALFRRAYTTVPSCMPARQVLLTGLCPQSSGVVGYDAKSFTTPNMPGLLADAGYHTALVGRHMHQNPENGACGYQTNILGSVHVDHDDYDQFLRKRAPEAGGISNLIEELGLTFNFWQAQAWPLAEELHPVDWTVAQSHKIVEEAGSNQPLFLTTSFYGPHPPFFPPQRFLNHYLSLDLPAVARGTWVDWESLNPPGTTLATMKPRVKLEGETLRRAQAGYFGSIEHIDETIGPLIQGFKARSETVGRPWVIVLTSDHGEMLGDHGYFAKCEPYEGSANIPFIIAASPELGFEPGLYAEMPVCLEDIMPTLLDMAGATCPTPLDGINLAPALRGQPLPGDTYLHSEHAICYSPQQAYHSLTDGRFKYIWRPTNGVEELFNLVNDPQEERNLADESEQTDVVATWRQRMVRRLADRPEGFVRNGTLLSGCPYTALSVGTPSPARLTL